MADWFFGMVSGVLVAFAVLYIGGGIFSGILQEFKQASRFRKVKDIISRMESCEFTAKSKDVALKDIYYLTKER